MTAPAIHVVDDDEALRESIAAVLASEGFAVSTHATAAELISQFDPQNTVCLVLDIRLPDLDGLTLLELLSERAPAVPAVMMTGHADVPTAVRAIRAGAADFIEKPFEPERLIESVRHAIARASLRAAATEPDLVARFATLTRRETEVMHQMVLGNRNKLIAEVLNLSPRTVEIHRARVMHKTGASSLSGLVRMALRAGLDPGEVS